MKLKIGFDIGGVLSKHPDLFKRFLDAFEGAVFDDDVELHVVTDIPYEKALRLLELNGFSKYFENRNVHSADWSLHGDRCKEVVMQGVGIDFMFDDRLDYIISGCPVGCLVLPRTDKPYYHSDWVDVRDDV